MSGKGFSFYPSDNSSQGSDNSQNNGTADGNEDPPEERKRRDSGILHHKWTQADRIRLVQYFDFKLTKFQFTFWNSRQIVS